MTYEAVFELGKKAGNATFLECIREISVGGWVAIIFFVLIGLGFFLAGICDDSLSVFVGIVIVIATLICTFGITSESVEKRQAAQWREDVVKPYILSLPEEKYELINASLTPINMVEFGSILHSKDAHAMSVSYLNEAGTFIKDIDYMEINMALDESEKPYITAHVLPENLGNDIDAGTYFMVVHAPKDYAF